MIPLKLKLSIVLLLIFQGVSGQNSNTDAAIKSNYRYDTDLLTKEFHAGRRAALRKELPPNALAVFFSNPVRNRSGDSDFEFHQDPNFYYLSGHTEPNSILLIFSEMQELNGQNFNEILFLEERTSSKELWTGRILGTSEAKKILGIQMILKNTEFQNFQLSLDKLEAIYMAPLLAVDAEEGAAIDLLSMQNRFTAMLAESGKSNLHSGPLNAIMSKLREVKQAEEIALMRKAINISCKAHLELMKALHSGMNEYQAQAILEYVFKNEGAEAPGYPSIVGSGENSCILHYSSNRKKMKEQELLLIDAGAEYHGYTADITRTLPVDGSYSVEEKIIYDLVLAAQEAGIAACRAGNSFYATHTAAAKVIQAGLHALGITKNESEYRSYFMHGTSHFLGLDAHDPNTRAMLQAGNVITVEPGIYIPEGSPCDKKWWNIGIRIEDDILITSDDPENLSGSLPRAAADIEALMKQQGFFEQGR